MSRPLEELKASGEDLNELMALIAQKTKRTLAQLGKLRIQKGRRVVQGETARGARQELQKGDLRNLKQLMALPSSGKASDYKSKLPNYEVSLDDEVLFRQEQDGTVTVNQVQLEPEQQFSYKEAFAFDYDPEMEDYSFFKAVEELESNQSKQPDIEYNFDSVEEKSQSVGEKAKSASLKQEIQEIEEQSKINSSPNPDQNELDSDGDRLTDAEEIAQGTDPFNSDTDKDGIGDAVDNNPNNPTQEQVQDPNQDKTWSVEDLTHAVRVAEEDVKKMPEGKGKQLLRGIVRGIKERVQSIAQRIANYPQWQRDRQAANTAIKLFKENYEQTGQTSYQGVGYDITLKGLDNYEITDKRGNSLLKFQKKALGVKVESSNLDTKDYEQFKRAQRSLSNKQQKVMQADSEHRLHKLQRLAPQRDREIVTAIYTKEVVDTANRFLYYMGVDKWDAGKQGNYNIEKAGNDIRITSKADGRGVVFERKNGQTTNNLNGKDFRHFRDLSKTLETRLQQVKSQQKNQQAAQKRSQVVDRERELSL